MEGFEKCSPEGRGAATALTNFGILYSGQARHIEAESLFRRGLLINEKVFGPDSPSTGAILNALAGALWSQGRFDEAEMEIRRALKISQDSYGPNHPETLGVRANLRRILNSKSTPG